LTCGNLRKRTELFRLYVDSWRSRGPLDITDGVGLLFNSCGSKRKIHSQSPVAKHIFEGNSAPKKVPLDIPQKIPGNSRWVKYRKFTHLKKRISRLIVVLLFDGLVHHQPT